MVSLNVARVPLSIYYLLKQCLTFKSYAFSSDNSKFDLGGRRFAAINLTCFVHDQSLHFRK